MKRAISHSACLPEQTWTFRIEEDYEVAAGDYVILTDEEHEALLLEADMLKMRNLEGQIRAVNTLQAQNQKLREAGKELLHLHLCEQEGMASGQPSPQQWLEAVDKLSEALKETEG